MNNILNLEDITQETYYQNKKQHYINFGFSEEESILKVEEEYEAIRNSLRFIRSEVILKRRNYIYFKFYDKYPCYYKSFSEFDINTPDLKCFMDTNEITLFDFGILTKSIYNFYLTNEKRIKTENIIFYNINTNEIAFKKDLDISLDENTLWELGYRRYIFDHILWNKVIKEIKYLISPYPIQVSNDSFQIDDNIIENNICKLEDYKK